MVYLLPALSGGRTSYHRPRCPIPSGIPAVSQNRRGQLISSLKWDVLPGNILHPALGIIRGLSFCTAFWTDRPTACRTGELTAPVRVTHPFHPLFGQSIDFRRTADSMG